MRRGTLTGTLGLALLALAACSGGDQGPASMLSETTGAAKEVIAAFSGARPPAVVDGIPAGLTRESIAGITTPMLLVSVPSARNAATLAPASVNAGHVTWVSPDRITVTTRDGVVTATRGLQYDVLSNDAAPTLAAISAGGAGSYSRDLRHIGDDRRISLTRLQCTMVASGAETVVVLGHSHATRHFVETCTDPAKASREGLRNDYWIGADGVMWKSRQFMHPVSGYIETSRLIR